LADEYRVKVKMKAGPFAVDDSGETVLKKAQLVPGGQVTSR
jgi:hypothetical protein